MCPLLYVFLRLMIAIEQEIRIKEMALYLVYALFDFVKALVPSPLRRIGIVRAGKCTTNLTRCIRIFNKLSCCVGTCDAKE